MKKTGNKVINKWQMSAKKCQTIILQNELERKLVESSLSTKVTGDKKATQMPKVYHITVKS